MGARDQKLFLAALDQLVEEKGLDKEELFVAIETAMLAAYKKNFKENENAIVEINRKNGAIVLKAQKTVVDVVTDVATEISLEYALKIKKNVKIGDVIEIEVNATDFRRNAIQNAKQIVIQKVREHEKFTRYTKFKKVEDSLVTVLVKKMDENGNLYIEINDIEAIIPAKELNPGDEFMQGDRVSVYIGEVAEGSKFTKVEYSRRNEKFLEKLLEREIPEIASGDIQIKAIAREAGSRSKIAVYSTDPNLDVKGACIGRSSTRIQRILSELNGEKLDLVLWDEDERIFVKNALSPANIYSIEIVEVENEKVANVEVDPNELSLAIGKKGQNSRLASRLCKLRINIKLDEEVAIKETDIETEMEEDIVNE